MRCPVAFVFHDGFITSRRRLMRRHGIGNRTNMLVEHLRKALGVCNAGSLMQPQRQRSTRRTFLERRQVIGDFVPAGFVGNEYVVDRLDAGVVIQCTQRNDRDFALGVEPRHG